MSIVEELRAASAEADELHARSRRTLVHAVRAASNAGMSQREIADAVGRSQPEVSRLLRFQPRSELGRLVQSHRAEITAMVRAAGGESVRVFGSVGRGEDGPGSDIDLLVDFPRAPSLFTLARLELTIAELLGVDVDVTPSSGLRPHLADRVRSEAALL